MSECGQPVHLGVSYFKDAGAVQSFMPCVLPVGHDGDCSWEPPSEDTSPFGAGVSGHSTEGNEDALVEPARPESPAANERRHAWSATSDDTRTTWTGECSCGWEGEPRHTCDEALRDGEAHTSAALGWRSA